MYEVYPTSWPPLGRPESAQEAVNRRALFEARMVTDFRGETATGPGLVSRVRDALAQRHARSAEPCNCPA